MVRLHHILLASLVWPGVVPAQDLEPRRWTHLPVGANVVGLTYAYTAGDVRFDPVLELADVEVAAHSVIASYVRSFNAFGKTGRLDLIVPYSNASWKGLLSGVPASTSREGLADPWVRMSVNLAGAPPLAGKEYLDFRAANPINTVVGAGVGVMLPLGEYEADKLLNLGQNRFVFRPQAGVVHTRGPWSYELTGSAFFFTENDDFFGGNERKQDPIFALQGHVIHTFSNRWWASVSAGYNWGGETRLTGERKDDRRNDILAALSIGVPIGQAHGLKFVYVHGNTQTRVGYDTDSFLVSWTFRF